MRTAITMGVIIALCTIATIATAQSQCEFNTCSPTGVCPPTGNSMGQSNYQRSPHPQPQAQPERQPIALPPAVGAGPKVEATLGEQRYIAVDEKYIYVLQGDEVVKLDKTSLNVVSRTKLNTPGK